MSKSAEISQETSLDLGENAFFKLENINPFVRLGNPGDGACFFYSFLQSYCGKNFIIQSPTETKKNVRLFRKKLSEYLSLETFKKLKLSSVSASSFNYYYQQAFKLVSMQKKNFEDLFAVMSQNDTLFSTMSVESIKEYVGTPLAEKYEALIEIAHKICIQILNTYSEYVDEPEISLVSEIFNVNILVMDMEGHLRRSDDILDSSKPSIITYYMNENHYECIGIVKQGQDGKKVVFSFEPGDEDIRKLVERTTDYREREKVKALLQPLPQKKGEVITLD